MKTIISAFLPIDYCFATQTNFSYQMRPAVSYADDVNLLGDNIDNIEKKHRNFNLC
jgi:hypothetical protein